MNWIRIPMIRWQGAAGLLGILLILAACTKNQEEQAKKDLPKIAVINGQPVYIDELELLGRLAHSKDANLAGVTFESPQGQESYKQKAPNLLNSLIDLYVIKYAAAEQGVTPEPQEVEAKFSLIKETLTKNNQYEQLLKLSGGDEQRLRDNVRDQMAMERLIAKIMGQEQGTPSETEITDHYYQNQKTYQFPATIRVSHIFLAAPKDKGEEARKQARERAEQLRGMIGEKPADTFVALAQKYSEDSSSAPRGGDLGFIDRNDPRLNKTFEDAAFVLKEGEVSPVVETDYGYHIIWATDLEKSLDEAREEIKTILTQKKKVDHYTQWLNQTREKMDIRILLDPNTFAFKDESASQPSPTPSA